LDGNSAPLKGIMMAQNTTEERALTASEKQKVFLAALVARNDTNE
jgi:hypothetical protein